MRNNLYTLLKANEKQVRKIVIKTLRDNGYEPVIEKDFIYAPGTVPVLLIAHYDTFAKSPRFVKNDNGILSGWTGNKPHQLGADDRAGIYAILETIPKHHCHVLFTGGEEVGGVGATAFTKSGIKPEVNYCLQFDRRGSNDAVYYDMDNPDFEAFITAQGWKTAQGSFTDIVTVCPYLGVMGVNLSIGYSAEHTINERLDTAVMNENIKRIPKLLDGERYEYKERVYRYGDWYGSYGRYGGYSGYGYGYGAGYMDEDAEAAIWDEAYECGYQDGYEKAMDEMQPYMDCGTSRQNFYVQYIDMDGQAEQEIVRAYDYYSAVGQVLAENKGLTFNHIITCTYMGRGVGKDRKEERLHG